MENDWRTLSRICSTKSLGRRSAILAMPFDEEYRTTVSYGDIKAVNLPLDMKTTKETLSCKAWNNSSMISSTCSGTSISISSWQLGLACSSSPERRGPTADFSGHPDSENLKLPFRRVLGPVEGRRRTAIRERSFVLSFRMMVLLRSVGCSDIDRVMSSRAI